MMILKLLINLVGLAGIFFIFFSVYLWIKALAEEDVESDLVKVVRCKDCKNLIKDTERGIIYCSCWGGLNGNNYSDFCSYGERKYEE